MGFNAWTIWHTWSRLDLIDHHHRWHDPIGINIQESDHGQGGISYVRCHVHMNTLRRMWTGLILNSRSVGVRWICLRFPQWLFVRISTTFIFWRFWWEGMNWKLRSLKLRCSLPSKSIRFFNINELVSHSDQVTSHSTSPLRKKKPFTI